MLLEHRTDFWESQHCGLFSLYHEPVEGQGLKCDIFEGYTKSIKWHLVGIECIILKISCK